VGEDEGRGGAVAGLVAVCLVAGAAAALAGASAWAAPGVVAAVVVAGIAGAAAPRRRRLVGLLAAHALLLAAWTAWFGSQQTSDFGVYFRCGTRDFAGAASWADWLARCQSAWMPETRLFWSRAILYVWPLGLVAGDGYGALKTWNVLLHLATVAGVYAVAGRWWGPRVGAIAAALLALWPEWWFTTTLATSDNLAVGGCVLFLHALARVGAGGRGALAWTAVAVGALTALELVRNLGGILLATVLLGAVVSRAGRGRLLGLFATAVVAHVGAGLALARLLGSAPGVESLSVLSELAWLDVSPAPAWADAYRWNRLVWPAIPPAHQVGFVAARLVTELARGPAAFMAYWWHKLATLLDGGGYYFFAATVDPANPDNVAVPVAHAIPYDPRMTAALRGYEIAVALVAAAGVARAPASAAGRAALAFVAAFCALMVGFWHVQARYVLVVAPAVCVLAALGAAAPPRLADAARVARATVWTLLGVVLGLAAACGLARVAARCRPHLADVRQEPPLWIGDRQCNAVAVRPALDARAAVLPVASDGGCTSFAATVVGVRRALQFFVARADAPVRPGPIPASPLAYEIALDGRVVASGDLAGVAVRFHHVDVAAGHGARALRVVVTGTAAAGALELWDVGG